MWQLWEDLEEWSVFDRKGEFGMFRARIIGRKIHIGYPLAQSMLTEPERKALPRVFYDAGLDPTSAPQPMNSRGRYGVLLRDRSFDQEQLS